MNFRLCTCFLLLLFSFLNIQRSISASTDTDRHYDTDTFKISKLLYKFAVLSSSGKSSKSKLNLFGTKFRPVKESKLFSIIQILLILSGIETNPGPDNIKYPCSLCNKNCGTNQASVACDSCNKWFHKHCLHMNSAIFNSLKNVSWYCCNCGLANFSSTLFCDSVSVSTSNSFSTLDSMEFDLSAAEFTTSTPISRSHENLNDNSLSGLHAVVVNFQSFFNKRIEFANYLHDFNVDIVLGTETWLSDDIKNSELCLYNYDIFRKDRISRGGGVFIAVKKCLFSDVIESCNDIESLFVKVKVKGRKSVIFGSVYRPPDSSLDFCTKTVNQIYKIYNKNKNSIFCLGGDYNLPDINWNDFEIRGTQYPLFINNLFMDMSNDLCLNQIVNEPTRGKSILDLLFTNRPEIFKSSNVISGVCDHDIFSTQLILKPMVKKPLKRKIYLWSNANELNIKVSCHDFKTKFFEKFSEDSDVLEMWDFIKNEINEIISKNVPTKMSSSRQHQPWINTITKRLIRRKQRWYKKARRSNDESIWQKYRKIKSDCQRTCRQTHNEYLNNLFKNDSNNKKLYSYVKNKRYENLGVPDLKSETGEILNDPLKKATLIGKHFNSVFSDPIPQITHVFDNNIFPDMQRIDVTKAGIKKLLDNLDPYKAMGPDNIPGHILKICANDLSDIFTLLFQNSLDQGVVPQDWKTANVMPLFKKGDKSKPENYRPISITCIPCKIIEHIVFSSIMKHLDYYDILNDSQHGFRKGRSCVSQLVTTLNDFSDTLKNKKQTDAILLDFSKAFDKVDHVGLLAKLRYYGVRGNLLDWISCFLIGRQQSVVIDGKSSLPTNVMSGVPQGTVLGPLFFLIYINDISKDLSPGTKIRLFADDSLLYRTINSARDCEILQRDLLTLQNWERLWKMEFHPGKCNLLQITNKMKPINFTYEIHDIPITKVDAAKYLGVIIDCKINWKKQYSYLINNCRKTLSFICRNLPKAPKHVKEQCYKSFVLPKIEYASSVWDPYCKKHINNLEKIQKAGARYVTGNYVMEAGNSLYNINSLGWDTLEERRLRAKLTVFQKGRFGVLRIPTEHLLTTTRRTRRGRDGNIYFREFSSINSNIHSFFPSTIRLWNNLPSDIRLCDEIDTFINKLKNVNLTEIRANFRPID